MNKDKCHRCGNTSSKIFWTFKDGSILCDTCEKHFGSKWEKQASVKQRIYNISIISLILSILSIIFISFGLALISLILATFSFYKMKKIYSNKGKYTSIISMGISLIPILLVSAWSLSGDYEQESSDTNSSLIIQESEEVRFQNTTSTTKTEKKLTLIFVQPAYRCGLNGDLDVDGSGLGKVINGTFLINESTYYKLFKYNSSLTLKGLTDSCFDKDANLPIYLSWYIYNLSESFEEQENLTFDCSFSPRSPESFQAMQGFIRPNEVKSFDDYNFLSEDLIDRIDQIARKNIWYRDDNSMFDVSDYWQTPAETEKHGYGDCEDWAIYTLSRILAYNSSLDCYNTLWDTHMSILCIIDNHFIIYDQGKTRFSTTIQKSYTPDELQESKSQLRQMRKDYFLDYGLSADERNLYALINDKEIIEFENNEGFVEWSINRVNKK